MLIARLIRLLWYAATAAAVAASWAAIHLFGSRIGPWAAGIAGVAAVAAVHPVVIGIEMIAARFLGDGVPRSLRLSPWGALRMYDAEIDASLRGLWFAVPWRWRRPAARPAAGVPSRPLALLFVHGYLCNRAVWLSFMRDAADRGYFCEALTLADPFASIDSHVDAVDGAIDALLASARDAGADARCVAIVGHSMGGLVARAALRRIETTRVVHVVTLGTPHRGTRLAHLGRTPSVRQMRPGNPWLAALEADEAAGRGLPRDAYTAVFSYHDHIVFPQASGRLAGAGDVAIGGCGHMALLFDRRVRSLVFERLGEAGRRLGSRRRP